LTTKVYRNENKCKEGWTSQDIRIYNTVLCRILEKFCGKLSHNKFVSDKIVFSNRECIMGFLDAYIGGDGFISKRSQSDRVYDINISSVSLTMLTDVMVMMKNIGVIATIHKPKKQLTNNRGSQDIKQLYNLVAFCRKVSIPFEVYAFTDQYFHEENMLDYNNQSHNVVEKNGDIALERFHLMNIFSSKMSASEFSYAAEKLLKFGNKDHYRTPHWLGLGGTPLNETIITAMKIVPKFQKDNKLQIVNTVILTDGEGSRTDRIIGEEPHNRVTKSTLIIRDPITKHQEIFWDHTSRKMTASYIKMLKARTQSNVLGFYILSPYTFKSKVYDFFGFGVDHDPIKVKFRNDKFLTLKSEGYDEYYLLNTNGMKIEDNVELIVEENATKRKLLTAFTKYAGKRNTSRVVLNRFIEMIA
jgi:hypothetical protein